MTLPTKDPTPGAMRAAETIILMRGKVNVGDFRRTAETIDRETGLPELISAIQAARARLAELGLAIPELEEVIAKAKGRP